MKTWGLLILLWLAPALILLAVLVGAYVRKAVREREESKLGSPGDTPTTRSSPPLE